MAKVRSELGSVVLLPKESDYTIVKYRVQLFKASLA